MGRLEKGNDVGKLEGAERDLEEETVGKYALFIQWTNNAAPPSLTINHPGHSGPQLTKDLGVVTETPTPPFWRHLLCLDPAGKYPIPSYLHLQYEVP